MITVIKYNVNHIALLFEEVIMTKNYTAEKFFKRSRHLY